MLKSIIFITIAFSSFLASNYNQSTKIQVGDNPPGTIQFIGNAGGDNVFTIEQWAFTQLENLDNPEIMQLKAVMDITSISCSYTDLNNNVKEKKDYFHMKKFPEASVVINGASRLSDGRYTTEAELSLKGVTKPVTLNFTMSGTAPYTIEAEGTIIRQDFKFKGDGPQNEVPVSVKATLVMAM